MNDKQTPPGIKPSTLNFARTARKAPGYKFSDFLHGYIYARWPYLYIGIGVGEHPIAKKLGPTYKFLTKIWKGRSNSNADLSGKDQPRTFAESYHGKVMPLDAVNKLVQVNKSIDIGDLEEILPYEKARDLIITHPDHIVALECPCRASRQSPCLPLDVCLIVGEPFASFVAEHHPENSRWIDQAEAVAILQAEDERGHVHHAFFKDAMLNRFYAICNCCSCCCGAMQSQRNGTPMLASSGYVVNIADDLCQACGQCVLNCQFDALSLENGTVELSFSRCMGCGICVNQCQNEALTLLLAPSKGLPLEISAYVE